MNRGWLGMFLTVIICTRNRAEDLRKSLLSLFCASNLEMRDWEMLVVETSSDHTVQICQDFQQRFPGHFRYLTEHRIGKSRALNTAILAAKGDVLAFADDDVLFDSNYVGSIKDVFNSYSADAAQGRVLLDCEGGWPAWLERDHLAVMADLQDWGEDVAEYKGTLCGTNMIVRADVFQKSGGFAPELGPGGLGMWEDTEVSLRMRRAGCTMIYAPQILVRHQWPKDRLTKSFIRSRFFGQGRAEAYYVQLPVPMWRFGAYVLKDTIAKELTSIWHRCVGRPGTALRRQCEARSHAGFFWQHVQFKRGTPRVLSVQTDSTPSEKMTVDS
jgi:glucosyl-dolichyl phosphate glucuronosyltransferase